MLPKLYGDYHGVCSQRTHHKRRGRKRSHSNKNKKKIKNKFILKLLRTLMNGTEEHLELDIYCKHKRLFPNNTFVRDLVTIMTDKNVKVLSSLYTLFSDELNGNKNHQENNPAIFHRRRPEQNTP